MYFLIIYLFTVNLALGKTLIWLREMLDTQRPIIAPGKFSVFYTMHLQPDEMTSWENWNTKHWCSYFSLRPMNIHKQAKLLHFN